MKKLKLLIPICIIILFIQCTHSSEKRGPAGIEERTLSSFSSVVLKGAANLNITNGHDYHVKVNAPINLIPMIQTKVENDQLIISMKNEFSLNDSKIDLEITTPSLKSVTVSGAGNVEIASFQVQKMKLTLSGAGKIRFSNSECDSLFAILSGAGNMYVDVSDYLEANLKGVGNIEYHGDPTVNSKISGVGNVVKK
jgi:hypothetical protein